MHRWLPVLALVACSGDGKDPDTTETPSVEAELTVAQGPLPGIVVVTVTTSEDAIVELEYGLEDTTSTHPDLSNGGTEHTFTVLGLKAGEEYQFEGSVLSIDSSTRTEVVTATVDPTIEDTPTFTVTTREDAEMCDPGGHVLLVWVQGGNSGVTILDMDGDIVWSFPLVDTDVQANRARVTEDGTGIVYTAAHALRTDLIGEVVHVPIDGIGPTTTDAPTAHHDVLTHADGTQAWLGYSFATYGCPDGSSIDDSVLDTIVEAQPGGSTTVVHDMNVDYPDPIDCEDGDDRFLPGRYDLTHANSLMYRQSEDAYYYMTRWHDNLVKVDRSSGQIEWELGGDYDDFTPAAGQDPEDLFHHGHMSDLWDGGMLVFDNNDPGPSWVREYAIDESAKTWEQTWAWNTEAFELLLGDVRRMPGCNDHVLITQSTAGTVRELLQGDDSTVWQVEADVFGTIVTRVEFIPNLYDLTSSKL